MGSSLTNESKSNRNFISFNNNITNNSLYFIPNSKRPYLLTHTSQNTQRHQV